jgi:hypothetical protein
VEELDPERGDWTILNAELPMERKYHAVCELEGQSASHAHPCISAFRTVVGPKLCLANQTWYSASEGLQQRTHEVSSDVAEQQHSLCHEQASYAHVAQAGCTSSAA